MQNATAAEIVYGKCTDQPKNMQASEKNITMYNECTEKQKKTMRDLERIQLNGES